jgi:hypothetical protein
MTERNELASVSGAEGMVREAMKTVRAPGEPIDSPGRGTGDVSRHPLLRSLTAVP